MRNAILSRRTILAGLATAAAAATSAKASGPQESAELIDLSNALPGHVEAYQAAAKKVADIAETWGPQWPTPCEEIIRFTNSENQHTDILGVPVKVKRHPGGFGQIVEIGSPEDFARSAESNEAEYQRRMGFKSQRGAKFSKQRAERDRAAIPLSEAYWSEVERIKEASGVDTAKEAQAAARDELQALVDQIMKTPETTIAGVVIKAQALEAWSSVDKFWRTFNLQGVDWAESLAASIIRQSQA